MNNHKLLFGCAHTQFHARRHLQFERGFPYGVNTWEEFIDQALRFADGYLDFLPIIYYPAYTYRPSGIFMIESEGPKEEFADEWEVVKRLSGNHNTPGRLVTYPGYEWTGNRRRWGDHNVIFFDEDEAVLDLSMDVDDLFSGIRDKRALAIPHHTGYQVGYRGKDWDRHDPRLSPVAEIYSTHGSSEAVDAPFDMRRNASMGPRVSGGTIQDGLNRGYRFGLIASGDNGGGFPGRWGRGLAAVWAPEHTREGVWEAMTARRTYGITGDRIRLDLTGNDMPMGSEIQVHGDVKIQGLVEGSDSVDRIELIRDGRVLDTVCHRGTWDVPSGDDIVAKLRVEVGWGPPPNKGVDLAEKRWNGSLKTVGGRITHVEQCFTRCGQRVRHETDHVAWSLTTGQNKMPYPDEDSQQALVFTIAGTPKTTIEITTESELFRTTLAAACARSTVIAHPEPARDFVSRKFGLDTYENQLQKEYANSYKTLIHRAVPEMAYRVPFTFTDRVGMGEHRYYYVRVTQDNGQAAWSSPIWADR